MDTYTNRYENNGYGCDLAHLNKVYLVEFKHKDSQKLFYKIGITHNSISHRFNHNLYSHDRLKYKEFTIKTIDVIYTPNKSVAEKIEKKLHEKFPKNFYLETYLNKPFNYYSNGFTGITETFIEDRNIKIKNVKQVFNNIKKIIKILYKDEIWQR